MSETFYKLTHEEFMELQKLRPSEKDVLLFLRTLTPFGDRPLNIGTKFIAEQLEISQRIVSRALKELDRLGLIEMELLSVSVTVNPFAKRSISKEDRHQCRDQSPEPSPNQLSTTPQTNKTNKTNKKRESDRNFKFFGI